MRRPAVRAPVWSRSSASAAVGLCPRGYRPGGLWPPSAARTLASPARHSGCALAVHVVREGPHRLPGAQADRGCRGRRAPRASCLGAADAGASPLRSASAPEAGRVVRDRVHRFGVRRRNPPVAGCPRRSGRPMLASRRARGCAPRAPGCCPGSGGGPRPAAGRDGAIRPPEGEALAQESDGGFTDWTARLLNDAKERCFISCVSTERSSPWRASAQVRRAVEVEYRAARPGRPARRGRPPRRRPRGRCDPVERVTAPGSASPAGVASSSAVMSVATYPGATEATVIPCGASATASDWPKACSPALLAP